MADVTLSNLRKSFGSVEVIPAISLDIADGEFIVLVGPSGCGKSTLLRMMAGLETISDGEFRIGDRRVNELDPKDRDVAMVFQNYALYPHMTVRANMGFSLEHRGATREQIAERVGWAAGILGLTHLLQRHPRQLSGGQRQRVAMGRAIVRDPQLFLFDEPLSNLDAKLRVVMRGEIKSLQRRLGTTMIYVTHDQVEAMTMADRVVVLNAGRVEQVGPPLVLYDRPVNRFVAGFIGSPAMNFLSGTVTAEGFRVGDAVLPLPGDVAVREGTSAVYGIRPEHLRIDPDGLDATIDLVEPTGSETQVTMTLAGVPLVGVFRERVLSKRGGTMRVSPQLQNVHLFSDGEDGARLH